MSASHLKNLSIPETLQAYSERDTILYALGLGLGLDPLDREQLDYVYEAQLKALPTMATVLAHERAWVRSPDLGLDHLKCVHGEQRLRLHHPVPVAGRLRGRTRIADVIDKGVGRAAVVVVETRLSMAESDVDVATTLQTFYFRGAGGFGGPAGVSAPLHPIPDRPADIAVERRTSPQSALIYRLSGDLTAFHADPDLARSVGFERPILHGLASFGVAGHAIVSTCCGGDPTRLKAIECRFTSPAFPGETFRIEIWRDGAAASFRAWVVERNVLVIDHGCAEVDVTDQCGISGM